MKRLVALMTAALLGGAVTGTAQAAPLPIPRAGAIQVLPQPGTDLTSLPLGDAKVTTTGPGAIHDGPWIDGDDDARAHDRYDRGSSPSRAMIPRTPMTAIHRRSRRGRRS